VCPVFPVSLDCPFFLLPLWCSLTFIYTCYSNRMLPGS
jgi:hypothetical protein